MMSPRPRHHCDAPELLPPAELLRLRAALTRAPSAATRTRHVAAASAAARERSSTAAGRIASRGVRGAAAVVAMLAVTSGLAAAQVLPPPAQRIFSSVSDRFAPEPDAPPASAGVADGAGGPSSEGSSGRDRPDAPAVATAPAPSSAPDFGAPKSTTSTRPTTTSTTVPTTTTTVPGPTGPGSSDGATDPGGVVDGPTDPGGGDGGPTDPGTTDGEPTDGTGGDDGTVSTTEVPTTVTTEDAVPPAAGSG